MMTTNSDLAAIAVDKSLLKEYQTKDGRTVYLDNDSEFQIKLFNPYTYNIEAEISIDGKSLGERLVIRPGQLVWLERYFDVAKKFKFSVYEVDASDSAVLRAISENGNIEIKFYKEKEKIHVSPYYDWNVYTLANSNCNIDSNVRSFCGTLTDTLSFSDLSASSVKGINCDLKGITTSYASNAPKKLKRSLNATIETGRVEKGGYSNQRFQTVDMDFEYWPFATEKIKLLPRSMKQVYKEDLQKIYCPECGRKVKPKFKFCPFCGNKL